jgi:hypothetical protein
MRGADIGRDLAELRPDLRGDLRVHHLAGDQRDRLAHEILKPTIHRLGDDIGNRHALTFGHRGVSNRLTAGTADEFGATVADPPGSTNPTLRYTTSTECAGNAAPAAVAGRCSRAPARPRCRPAPRGGCGSSVRRNPAELITTPTIGARRQPTAQLPTLEPSRRARVGHGWGL